MGNLWKKDAEGRADAIIERLLKARNSVNSASMWKGIVDAISWPANLYTALDFLALSGCAQPDKLSESMIMKVLEHGLSKPYHQTFEQAYLNLEAKRRTQSCFRWTSCIPLKIDFPPNDPLRRITICGLTFKVTSLKTIEDRMGSSRFADIVKRASCYANCDPKSLPKHWLMCETTTVGFHESWGEIALPFCALRGLLEMVANGLSFQFSSPFKPRFCLPFPSYVIGMSETRECDFYYFPKLHDEKIEKAHTVTSKELKQVRAVARLLSRVPPDKSIELLIANCLRLYSCSVDDVDSRYCLLSLWQMAEYLTLSEKYGGKTDVVVKRLAWFGAGLKDVHQTTLQDALTAIAQNRNCIVHRGIVEEVDAEYIYFIQIACVSGIRWLLKRRAVLRDTDRLDLFYRYCTEGDVKLQDNADIIRLVRETRRRG